MRELKNESRKSIVYIDRIKFTFYTNHNDLKAFVKNDQIRISKISKDYNKPCMIDISQPSLECLQELLTISRQNNIAYKVSYIEIARDTAYESQSLAECAKHQLSKTQRKKYSAGMTYDGRDRRINVRKGLISDSTDYHGSPSLKINNGGNVNIKIGGYFKFSIYVKISPKLGCECLHEEFRINRANVISKKIGIKYLEELLKSDLENIFEMLERKYIIYFAVCNEKLGLSLLGLCNCRKPSDSLKMKAQLMGLLFRQKYGMKPFELIGRLMIEQKRLRHINGRKSDWQKTILNLKNERFLNKIARPI